MANPFAKKVEPPKVEYQVVDSPGQARQAVLAGSIFELYRKKWMLENQYQIQNNDVVGFSRGSPIKIGWLAPDENGALQFHSQRVDNPDYTTLNAEFRRFWELLEGGCRLNPEVEVRCYD